MSRIFLVALAALGAAGSTEFAVPVAPPVFRVSSAADTVLVPPPTGETEADRASILAALGEAVPGGTVQFAPGTYLVGRGISVTVPRITLVGHPRGTIIRGCRPDDLGDSQSMLRNCYGFELAGQGQTVREFTFEYAFWALHLGCCIGERTELRAPDGAIHEVTLLRPTEGGYLVEDNVFTTSRSGLRVNGVWEEPAVVQGNRFLNNWHSASIHGGPVHLLDNEISAPEPGRVPLAGVPWDAVSITPGFPGVPGPCDGNVIAGNRIEGVPDGIKIEAVGPDARCRHNVIRDNTIELRRVRVLQRTVEELGLGDTTMVMIPVAIRNLSGEALLEDNLIEGNRILGAEGLAIEVLGASRNRIVDNTISRLRENGRIPETTPFGQPTPWRHANGSAIWLSSGSDENQILDNTFDDVAGPAVFVEGDRNLVITRSPEDEVRNLGSGNRVTARPGTHSLYNTADSEEIAVRRTLDAYFTAFKAQDTTRIRELTAPDFVLYEGGFPVERDRWTETWDPATAASPGRQAAEHRFRDMEITILGDVASLSYVLEWLEDGEVSIRGRETGLARNLDGSWRFVRFHSTWFPPIRSRGGGALDDYVGTYRAEGLDLTWDLLVVRDGERLYMVRDDGKPQLAGLVRLQLFPEADDRFYLEVTTDRVVMDRDSTRAVVGLTVHPSILWGQAFRWIRIEEASR